MYHFTFFVQHKLNPQIKVCEGLVRFERLEIIFSLHKQHAFLNLKTVYEDEGLGRLDRFREPTQLVLRGSEY